MSDKLIPNLSLAGRRELTLAAHASSARRLNALFRAMASDFLLREQFVTDPAQIISEYVDGTSLLPATASVANQLLFSVMANRRLRAWLSDYARHHTSGQMSRQEFLADFGRAVAKAGDDHISFALIRSAVEKDGFDAFESIITSLMPVLRLGPVSGPTGGPPTGGPPTGGPPTGGPPTGGPPTGGPPTGGPPTGGPPTGGPPTGGPPTGGPPTGGPPTGGPPTGGPPTDGSAFHHLPDYVSLSLDELSRYAVHLREIRALEFHAAPGVHG